MCISSATLPLSERNCHPHFFRTFGDEIDFGVNSLLTLDLVNKRTESWSRNFGRRDIRNVLGGWVIRTRIMLLIQWKLPSFVTASWPSCRVINPLSRPTRSISQGFDSRKGAVSKLRVRFFDHLLPISRSNRSPIAR